MISEKIKELRELAGYSQAQLAKKLDVTRSSVNAWEMAISIPSSKILPELCKVLHTTSDYLLGMDDAELLSLKYYSDAEREILYRLKQKTDKKNPDTDTKRGLL